jgi:hypothetical protein
MRSRFALRIILGWSSLHFALAVFGIDISPSATGGPAMSNATASCLAGAGAKFAIVASSKTDGTYDASVVQTTTALLFNASVPHVDVSFSLCAGSDPSSLVNNLVTSLDNDGVLSTIGMMWPLFVATSAPGCGWSKQWPDNCAYIQSVISQLELNGVRWGIFSTQSDWTSLVGNSGCYLDMGSQQGIVQLWYSDIDGNPSFSDFTPWANFTQPAIKQYALNDRTNKCGFAGSINDDYY